MIIGIKNVSHLHQLEKVTIKPILFILLMVGILPPQAADSLDFDKQKLASFFSQFIFGFNLKSYTFNKYKTLNKEKIDQKLILKL